MGHVNNICLTEGIVGKEFRYFESWIDHLGSCQYR